MASSCNRGNETSGSVKCGDFLDYRRTVYPLKTDFALWSKEVPKSDCIRKVKSVNTVERHCYFTPSI